MATVARATTETRESEAAVVGAMLIDSRCIGDVLDILRADDFADRDTSRIFAAVVAASDAGEDVDVISVAGRLDAAERRDPGSWLRSVMHASESVGTASGVVHHARQVAAASRIRRVADAAEAAAAALRRASIHDVDDAADAAVDLVTASASWDRVAATSGTAKEEARSVMAAVSSAYDAMRSGADPNPDAVRWGLTDLDKLTGPIQAGTLTVVAGRPGAGKTILGEMVASLAVESGGGAVFISAEMPRAAVAMRSISRVASVSIEAMTTGKLTDHDVTRLIEGVRRVSVAGARLLIDDKSAPTCGHIRRAMGRWERTNPGARLRVVVVDYLQQLASDNPRHSAYERASAVSSGLLGIAKDTGVPVVALAQLSRKCEERADKRPMLSDLRESGQIEQDAHMVVTVYRDELHNKHSEDRGVAELAVIKNRTGALGTARVSFQGEFSRFADLAQGQRYEEKMQSARRPGRRPSDGRDWRSGD